MNSQAAAQFKRDFGNHEIFLYRVCPLIKVMVFVFTRYSKKKRKKKQACKKSVNFTTKSMTYDKPKRSPRSGPIFTVLTLQLFVLNQSFPPTAKPLWIPAFATLFSKKSIPENNGTLLVRDSIPSFSRQLHFGCGYLVSREVFVCLFEKLFFENYFLNLFLFLFVI